MNESKITYRHNRVVQLPDDSITLKETQEILARLISAMQMEVIETVATSGAESYTRYSVDKIGRW